MFQTRCSVVLTVITLPILAALGGCSRNESTETASSPISDRSVTPDVTTDTTRDPLSVYVVNYPLQYFAERLGGDHVDVVFPAPPDIDPAHWSPDADKIAAYQSADLILVHGGYAKWTERVSLPLSRLVDTSVGFAERLLPSEEATVHSHGPEGEHSHRDTAFTTWLDPSLAIEQARAVTAALVKARPEQEAHFRDRLAVLEADLQDLDDRIAAATTSLGEEPVIFSHPVYQYLTHRFELNGRSLHWEPSEPPSDHMWRDLERWLAEHPARWMIWEDEPLEETARHITTLGIQNLVFTPCANVPTDGDWLTVMQRNVSLLEAAVS